MSFIENRNDQFSWYHGYNQVFQAEQNIKQGRVINVKRSNHLSLRYDVELFDTGGAIVRECRVATAEAGMNGNGVAQPLNDGTPVIVAFKNGMMQDGLILGCFNTEGNYKDFYQDGKLQEPGQLENGAEYNQPLGHPNRITQEDSYFHAFGGKTLSSAYDSPEFHILPEDRLKAYPQPGSIVMRNQGGDIVQYTSGTNIIYSEGNIVTVSGGDREEKSSKLLRFSAMHARRATLFNGTVIQPATAEEAVKKSPNEIIPLIAKTPKPGSSGESIPESYRVEQEKKLAELYANAAKAQNQLTAARQTTANQIQQQYGSELGQPGGPAQVPPNYSPKQEQKQANSSNYGERRAEDVNGTPIANDLIVVLHETVGSADSALNLFSNSGAEVSYHALIKRDGSVVTIVPPSARAFGAANSDFNGEAVQLTISAPSVNNFAYHISLESPEDGRGNNSTHSGYTQAQYQSLAWLVSRTGVQDGRITTHAEVDNSGERMDPRSFDNALFRRLLAAYPRQRQMNFGAGIR